MSTGYSALQEADFDALAAVGEQWSGLAAHLAEQVEALESALDRRLTEDHWSGDAADSARERIRAVVTELEQRIDPAGKAAAAIADAVSAFKQCQADLAEFLDENPELDDPESDSEDDTRLAEILERAADVDEELRARIALLDETEVEQVQRLAAPADPAGTLTEMLAGGAAPKAVNNWWDSLTGSDHEELIGSRPELVGRTDGVPADARDEANRQRLGAQLQKLDAEISQVREQISRAERSGDEDRVDSLRERLGDLTETRGDLATVEKRIAGPDKVTGQDHYLLDYDGAGDGRAVIALGNPDLADNTAVFVPGTGAELGKTGDMNRTAIMARDAHEAAPGEDTSLVMWLGYDAPDNALTDAPSLSYAKNGSGDLSSFMGGLQATGRDPEHSNTTVIGHSYGTTVIGQSAKEHGLATDRIIAVASPGMNVGGAAELGIDPGEVWATTAPGDVIHVPAAIDVPLPGGDHLGLGPSPVDGDFGGRIFDSDAMSWNPLDIHSNYWDEGNAARDNMAFIITGQTDKVG